MSSASSLRRSRTAATLDDEHNITLIDSERPAQRISAEQSDSEAPTAPGTPGTPLVKRLTSNSLALQQSLKRELTNRKYAKYNRKRYDHGQVPEDAELDTSGEAQEGESASPAQPGYFGRGTGKVKKLLKRKRTLGMGKHEQDAVIDVLYENQRGAFFFGVPKYSHSSLLPRFDPKAWQNAQFRTSPVDIRNAQVPDPSWEWAWKSWYVDMSRDVDDEGWEYSITFGGQGGWHGNHPWFHSFVRRRRWLRMRRRRDIAHKTKEKSHELTADYFTIHPKTLRPASEDFSKVASTYLAKMEKQIEDEIDVEKMEIADIGSLDLALKKATVDREKLVAVRKFVDTGGDELYYLSERMPGIMNMLVFQSSRRQLLTDLLAHFDQARRRRESLKDHMHSDTEGQQEHNDAARQAENLMRAVQAADEQVKRLEYWSDIKSMAEGGRTLQDTVEGKGHWDDSKWQGLSPTNAESHPMDSFVNKQKASEGAPTLHKHSEHSTGDEKGEGEGKSGSVWFDAREKSEKGVSEGDGDEWATAGESASEVSKRRGKKGKGKAKALDGVAEDNEEGENDDADNDNDQFPSREAEPVKATTTTSPEREPSIPSSPRKQPKSQHSVRLVEPVAVIDDPARQDSVETMTQDAAAHQEYLRQQEKGTLGTSGVGS